MLKHQQVEVTIKINLWVDIELNKQAIKDMTNSVIQHAFIEEMQEVLPEYRVTEIIVKEESEI